MIKSIWLSLRGVYKRLIDVNYFFNSCKIIGLCACVGILKLDDVQWTLIAPTLFSPRWVGVAVGTKRQKKPRLEKSKRGFLWY